CQNRSTIAELQKMDTLERMMADVEGALMLDENSITSRIDSMGKTIASLEATPDKVSKGDLKSALVKYQGIRATYVQVLRDYPVVTFDADQEKQNLTAL